MALKFKPTHNIVAFLTKSPDHTQYHSIIDLLLKSQYKTALTINPPVYKSALQQFWANATEIKTGDTVTGLQSTVGTNQVVITPELLSKVLVLSDDNEPISFAFR